MKYMKCKTCGGTGFSIAQITFASPDLYAPSKHDIYFCVDCGTVRVGEETREKAFREREESKKRDKEYKLQHMCFMCDKACSQNPDCERYQGALWMIKQEE